MPMMPLTMTTRSWWQRIVRPWAQFSLCHRLLLKTVTYSLQTLMMISWRSWYVSAPHFQRFCG